MPTTKAPAKESAKDSAKKAVPTKSGATKATAAKTTGSKAAPKKAPAKGGGGSAFSAPLKPSKDLAAVLGDKPLARTEAVSRIWDYIRKNNLQNPENKREIVADEKLKAVFDGKPKVTMFEMNKHLNKHLEK